MDVDFISLSFNIKLIFFRKSKAEIIIYRTNDKLCGLKIYAFLSDSLHNLLQIVCAGTKASI